MIKVGDKVKLIEDHQTFFHYDTFHSINKLDNSRFVSGYCMELGDKGTVIFVGRHSSTVDVTVAVVRDTKGMETIVVVEALSVYVDNLFETEE